MLFYLNCNVAVRTTRDYWQGGGGRRHFDFDWRPIQGSEW